jgi:hypothetical protein
MVKASRRVKRIKRSKKQVHRARGRKTNRRRYTRRQRGGAIITVCKKTHTGIIPSEDNASGIDITYDNVRKIFKIGSADYATVDSLLSFKGAARYARAVQILTVLGITTTSLNRPQFIAFSALYCKDVQDKQCETIMVVCNGTIEYSLSDAVNAIIAFPAVSDVVTPLAVAKWGQDQLDQRKRIAVARGVKPGLLPMHAPAVVVESERVSLNDRIRLERIGVKGKMLLHYGPVTRDLILDKPVSFEIPNNPKYPQYIQPVTELIFLGTEQGTTADITVEFMLNLDQPMALCAMKRYKDECVRYSRHDEFDHEKLSIKISLRLTGFFASNTMGVGDQILPLIDKLQQFANDCAKEAKEDDDAGDHAEVEPFKVSDPQVYINLITKHIAECSQRIDKEKVFSPEQKLLFKADITAFQQRLNDLKQTKDLEALKTLHEEVNQFLNVKLVQAKKTQASLAVRMGDLSVRGPGAGAAGRP